MSERPTATTVGGLLRDLAASHPDDLGLVCGNVRLTWSELADKVAALTAGWGTLGIGPGDRVAMLAANSAEWIICDLAVASVGAVFMGLNTWYPAADLRYVLEQSGAKVMVTASELFGRPLLPMVRGVVDECPTVEHLVVIGEPGPEDVSFSELAATVPTVFTAPSIVPEDAAAILYTSGSTAHPKGVVLHHGDLVANGWEIGERQHLRHGDRLWLGIPLFFSFGSANALFAALTHGVALIVQERFDAAVAVELIDREQCTVYYGMGHMTRALLDERDRRGLALESLRTGLTIGPPAVIRMTADLVPGICNIYGLTETYGNCAVTDADEPLALRMESQGQLLPGFEALVVDPETLAPLDAGQSGVLLIRGRVTSGYFRDPERTNEAFRRPTWFDTGDLGSVDADGRLRYEGRAKEMLKVGGINVSPAGVEDVLLDFAGVRQAHVVGVPDSERGEQPVAVLEWEPGIEPDLDALRAHCRVRLASYAMPVDFLAWSDESLPRTGTGKVRRAELALLVGRQRLQVPHT